MNHIPVAIRDGELDTNFFEPRRREEREGRRRKKRYLAERLVEAWETAERENPGKVVIAPEGTLSQFRPDECPIPKDSDERLTVARRIVAERCLYGVDKNPLAVEMAKLSLWLITLAQGRPFTFLNHALKRINQNLQPLPQLRRNRPRH
ncbi:Eco57I restriction-modification methylase domain-containing protein [Aerosakkonemataceae cyanobacterium BLCC-F50]|uniref:site-specific DNA-methyltransferase (adenine-specific) n=1 Tax=Floridaenema flaviceps BLCC-F50 TaxID=3153642 RepID=A0ABV4Y193_9CYAN